MSQFINKLIATFIFNIFATFNDIIYYLLTESFIHLFLILAGSALHREVAEAKTYT